MRLADYRLILGFKKSLLLESGTLKLYVRHGLLAQLVEALVLGTRQSGFESQVVHQKKLDFLRNFLYNIYRK